MCLECRRVGRRGPVEWVALDELGAQDTAVVPTVFGLVDRLCQHRGGARLSSCACRRCACGVRIRQRVGWCAVWLSG